MNVKTVIIGLFLTVVAFVGATYFTSIASAKDKDVSPGIKKELKQVIENQQEILSRLDDIMKEVKIVKIRATN